MDTPAIREPAAGFNGLGPPGFRLGRTRCPSLLAAPAGVAAAWPLSDIGDPQELRAARIRQGLLAGAVADAVCGRMFTPMFPLAFFMMIIGPLAGAAAGPAAADHPRKPR